MTDGYFHTEDIGEIDKDGFLKITDRKKQIFKTSGGKYIAPQILENTIKQSRFIEHIMVIGEGEKMPTAIIQPNFERSEERRVGKARRCRESASEAKRTTYNKSHG